MNSTTLKLIAVIAMVLDHVAWVLFPSMSIFHLIGKIAFPIFCFMIAEGYLKTRNKKKYLFRLIAIAVISEIPFIMTFRLAFGQNFSGFDTIFDLVLGLIAIWIYDKYKFKGRILIVIAIGVAAYLIGIDGDLFGVLAIFIFYKYHDDFKNICIRYISLSVIEYFSLTVAIPVIQSIFIGVPMGQIISVIGQVNYWMPLLAEVFGLCLALIPLKFYNGKKGVNLKYVFYGFYPVHLIILYAIKMLS